jgi:hypothetical protein
MLNVWHYASQGTKSGSDALYALASSRPLQHHDCLRPSCASWYLIIEHVLLPRSVCLQLPALLRISPAAPRWGSCVSYNECAAACEGRADTKHINIPGHTTAGWVARLLFASATGLVFDGFSLERFLAVVQSAHAAVRLDTNCCMLLELVAKIGVRGMDSRQQPALGNPVASPFLGAALHSIAEFLPSWNLAHPTLPIARLTFSKKH